MAVYRQLEGVLIYPPDFTSGRRFLKPRIALSPSTAWVPESVSEDDDLSTSIVS